MKQATFITAFLCLMSFTTLVSCNKDKQKDKQENNQGSSNNNNPDEPFQGCKIADGTDPASFTIGGINYVANDRASAILMEGEDVVVNLGWTDNNGKAITVQLTLRNRSYNGPGHYSTRNEDGLNALVLLDGGFSEDGLYVFYDSEKSYLDICIEEIEFGKKIKGYFNAELVGSDDLVHANRHIKITDGYFKIIH